MGRIGTDQFAELSSAIIRHLPRDIDTSQGQHWIDHPVELEAELRAALIKNAEKAATTAGAAVASAPNPANFFRPLTDKEAEAWYIEQAKRKFSEKGARDVIAGYRALNRRDGVPDEFRVFAEVVRGLTLKRHIPLMGHCRDKFSYLQKWDFKDRPTRRCVVAWSPRLVSSSLFKTVDQQLELLVALRREFDLPKGHLASFGSATLIAGMAGAHFQATMERVPLNMLWTRTDVVRSVGFRLDLGGFDGTGLDCGDWGWPDDERGGDLGCLALGVELGR